MTHTYTELKALLNMTDRDTVETYINGARSYDTNYKILTEEDAKQNVYDSYEGDNYILGSFNADFIEDFIPLDYEDIKIIQDGENYEVIGKLIMNSGNFEDMMDEYIRLGGYGYALGSYDGDYEEYNGLIIYRQN